MGQVFSLKGLSNLHGSQLRAARLTLPHTTTNGLRRDPGAQEEQGMQRWGRGMGCAWMGREHILPTKRTVQKQLVALPAVQEESWGWGQAVSPSEDSPTEPGSDSLLPDSPRELQASQSPTEQLWAGVLHGLSHCSSTGDCLSFLDLTCGQEPHHVLCPAGPLAGASDGYFSWCPRFAVPYSPL